MPLKLQEPLTPDVRQLQLLFSGLKSDFLDMQAELDLQGQSIGNIIDIQTTPDAAPVANLLWNGELGHSVHTWHDSSDPLPPVDKQQECAWWFSHNAPPEPMGFVDASVSAASNTITLTGHEFTTGCTVDLTSTGTLPAGLDDNTTYFVIRIDADTIKLATSIGNAFSSTAIDITAAAGGGTHLIQQLLVSTDSRDSNVNNELKTTDHAHYLDQYSRWNAEGGWGELNSTMTLDALMPSNLVDASTPLARVSMISARRHSFIEIPDACLIGAGIWDNTSGQRKFLPGDSGFTATFSGTGTVERRYRILTTSDRGFSVLSSEVTILHGPADSEFSSTNNIVMAWLQQAGQLQVEIYEYLPAGGNGSSAEEYRLVAQVSASTSYIHEGSYQSVVLGYPPPDAENAAVFFSSTGNLSQLAIDRVSSKWDTVNMPISVPANYSKANTTGREWVRIWLTVAPNLLVTDCTTNGSTTITAPTAAGDIPTAFDAEYASSYAGLVAQVYDVNENLLVTTTVVSRTSDTAMVLADSVATGTERVIRIIGGGFHGVYLDKIHLGYQSNTSYAPNALDQRFLNPRAAPDGSGQGGVGGGDPTGDGGGVSCVAGTTPIKMHAGIWKAIQTTRPGQKWAAAGLVPNILLHLRQGLENVRLVRSANGCEVICTDTECFVVDDRDKRGTPLHRLRIGDPVMTEIDGRIEQSALVEIGPLLEKTTVYTPTLHQNHLFIAGIIRRSWWQRITDRVVTRRRVYGGFVLHNRKREDGDVIFN